MPVIKCRFRALLYRKIDMDYFVELLVHPYTELIIERSRTLPRAELVLQN